jgi:membrane protein
VAPAEVVKPLASEIRSIVTEPRAGLLSIAGLLTIWSAMAGVDSVRVGLNRAYDLRETRSSLRLYLLNVAFVVGAAAFLVALSLLLIVLPLALAIIERYVPGSRANFETLLQLRYPVAMLLLFLALHIAHRLLPAKPLPARQVLPGILLTLIIWTLLSFGFTKWLENFNSFASTYASLSGFFAAMFFLYLAAIVLIFGGEFNRVLELQRAGEPPAKPSSQFEKTQ